jgi:hypothetical protein
LHFPKRLSNLLQSLQVAKKQPEEPLIPEKPKEPLEKNSGNSSARTAHLPESNYDFNFVAASARLKLKIPQGSRFKCAPQSLIVDLLRPNAKFQSYERCEAQQYQIGFDDVTMSLGLNDEEEITIATLMATSNGYSTEPILVTLNSPESILQEPLGTDSSTEEEFSEESHVYSSVVWDKNLNKNWKPFKVNVTWRGNTNK